MYHDQQSGQDVPIFNSVDEAEATAKAMGLPVGTPILIRTQNGKAVVGYVR
jgi:hypothetical protein